MTRHLKVSAQKKSLLEVKSVFPKTYNVCFESLVNLTLFLEVIDLFLHIDMFYLIL